MFRFVAILAAAAFVAVGSAQAQPTKELTLWTHWAAEQIKRQYVEEAIADFEKKNPGIKIKASWYEKNALYAALKTALRAGQAPDIFYAEPDQAEYYENSFLLDLSSLNWAAIEPWAKEIWSYKGKPYGLPLEASATAGLGDAKPMGLWDILLHLFPSNVIEHAAPVELRNVRMNGAIVA